MDPNTALSTLREARETFSNAENDETALDAAQDMSEAVSALDEWLSKGGFLPEEWKRFPALEHDERTR